MWLIDLRCGLIKNEISMLLMSSHISNPWSTRIKIWYVILQNNTLNYIESKYGSESTKQYTQVYGWQKG